MASAIPENDMAEQASEVFRRNSAEFLNWYTGLAGSRWNPKLELTDLRSRAAGRGIGLYI